MIEVYFKIVVVRNTLGRRFRIVAAVAMLVDENGPHPLLVAKRRFYDFKRYRPRLAGRNCAELVSPRDGAQGDRRGCLSAGIGEHRGRGKVDVRRAVKLNQRSGNRSPLAVVYLHDQRIFQRRASDADLVAAA
jgi:hypothetical protein